MKTSSLGAFGRKITHMKVLRPSKAAWKSHGEYDGRARDSCGLADGRKFGCVLDIPLPKARMKSASTARNWYVDHISDSDDDKMHCLEIVANVRTVDMSNELSPLMMAYTVS